jgi:peptide/nickel transport system ATP-binding protein
VDASLRATILESLRNLNREYGISILYITHDLTTAFHVAKSIVVLYRGSIVEAGDVDAVIKKPKHPYTRLLIDSIPWPDLNRRWGEEQLPAKEGDAATSSGGRLGKGCKFASRCPFVMDECHAAPPPYYQLEQHHAAMCYLLKESPTFARERLTELLPV